MKTGDPHASDCWCFFCREGDPDAEPEPDDLPSTADPGVVTDPKEE